MKRPTMRATLLNGRSPDWYKITNVAGSNAADVMIYGEIGWDVMSSQFVNELNGLDVGTINLRINSPGGDVFDGVAIYNALKNHPATVNVSVDGFAASAASFIAQAGDTRTMQLGSQLMIHDASSISYGNAAEMRSLADLLDRTSDSIADIYAARAGGEAKEWRKRMKAETWYSAREAVDAGLADSVAGVEVESDSEPIAAKHDLSVFNFRYAGRNAAPTPEILRPDSTVEPSGFPDAPPEFDFDLFRATLAGLSTREGAVT